MLIIIIFLKTEHCFKVSLQLGIPEQGRHRDNGEADRLAREDSAANID